MNHCPNHPDKKTYAKGVCRSCYEKQLRQSNPEFLESQRQNTKKWINANKEKKIEADKSYRERNPQDSIRKRESMLKRVYGITLEDYNKLLAEQSGKCYICNREPYSNKPLHVDHCHKTGEVRGLLCARCNWYLGVIEKKPTTLTNLLNYLENKCKILNIKDLGLMRVNSDMT